MTKLYIPRRRRLFLDLDGVGADFDGGYYALYGHWPWEVDDDTMWANVRKADRFFANLPVLPGFLDAVRDFVRAGYEPMFLTACPPHDYQDIADQKYEWVHKNVPWDITMLPVVKGKNKARFVQNPGDVLVDDFEKNLGPWVEAGGIAVLHRDWAESLPIVHKHMRDGLLQVISSKQAVLDAMRKQDAERRVEDAIRLNAEVADTGVAAG